MSVRGQFWLKKRRKNRKFSFQRQLMVLTCKTAQRGKTQIIWRMRKPWYLLKRLKDSHQLNSTAAAGKIKYMEYIWTKISTIQQFNTTRICYKPLLASLLWMCFCGTLTSQQEGERKDLSPHRVLINDYILLYTSCCLWLSVNHFAASLLRWVERRMSPTISSSWQSTDPAQLICHLTIFKYTRCD